MLINDIISPNNKKARGKINKLRVNDGVIVQNDSDIANALNDYFSTVGTNIANSFIGHHGSPAQYLTGDYPNSFFFSPATVDDIKSYILSLKNKKCSTNDFPSFLLKQVCPIVCPILCHLVNLSISSATFPDFLKVARVVPLPKGGDDSDMSNYRPISVLNILSKIIEKHAHRKLYSYLESLKILNDNQFGFRYKRGTSQAVLRHTWNSFMMDSIMMI